MNMIFENGKCLEFGVPKLLRVAKVESCVFQTLNTPNFKYSKLFVLQTL